jgi:hypothetical protein
MTVWAICFIIGALHCRDFETTTYPTHELCEAAKKEWFARMKTPFSPEMWKSLNLEGDGDDHWHCHRIEVPVA